MKQDEAIVSSQGPDIDPDAPRICLMGNSHSQVYREALDEDPAPFDKVHLDIFSTNLIGWQTVSVRDDKLVASDPNVTQRWQNQPPHKDEINPAEYDAFVLSGLGIRYDFALRALLRLDIFPGVSDNRLVSRAAIKAMLVAIFEDSVANFLISSVREMSDAPIALIFTPVPGETYLEKSHYVDLSESEAAQCVALARQLTEEAALEVVGDKARVILPDESLLSAKGLTQRHLLRSGGKRMGDLEPHDPGYDHTHMNGEYGRHMLNRFAPVFAEMMAELPR
jgi:hypothetical protein